MITLKQGLKLSAIIEKLDININPDLESEQIGVDVMKQILTKAYKAESEIYVFVAEIKNITPKEAENIDLIQFIKELTKNESIIGFFKSAVK